MAPILEKCGLVYPERRKVKQRKKDRKERKTRSSISSEEARKAHPTPPPLPEDFDNNHGDLFRRPKATWCSPRRHSSASFAEASAAGQPNRNGPTRKSFRVAGHVRDLRVERNVLPLWLEETFERSWQSSDRNGENDRNKAAAHDHSFESRWDSMKEKNKNQQPFSTGRPTGWEAIDQQRECTNKKTHKTKSNFCPTFTINDISDDCLHLKAFTGTEPLSSSVRVTIKPPPVYISEHQKGDRLCQSDVFDMAELSSNFDNLFADCFHEEQKHQYSASTTNIAPYSASNSTSRIPSQASTSTMTDKHLWASSESFICEEFSSCRMKPSERACPYSPPRSYSQIVLNEQETDRHAFTVRDGMYTEKQILSSGGFPSENTFDQHENEADRRSLYSLNQQSTDGNDMNTSTSCEFNPECIVEASLDLPDTMNNMLFQENKLYMESSHYNPTIIVTDHLSRQHWIQFDNSSIEHLDYIMSRGFERGSGNSFRWDNGNVHFEHQSNFSLYQKNSLESATSPASPTSSVLARNNSGSTLNLVEPSLEPAPEIYRGQFVQSKRVTRTVSQKINPPEYDKLTEPILPMLSRAALTMVSGPGLFERRESPTESSEEIEDGQSEEWPSTTATESSKANGRNKSYLSPAFQNRAGSLRVPRLPALFLRRSVSLHVPKVSRRQLLFQRLPERRGSFHKAMSGIGAIARNIRRRSSNLQTSASASTPATEKVSNGGPPSHLHRSGSIGASLTRQTPKAPRLPRRDISHKQTNQIK